MTALSSSLTPCASPSTEAGEDNTRLLSLRARLQGCSVIPFDSLSQRRYVAECHADLHVLASGFETRPVNCHSSIMTGVRAQAVDCDWPDALAHQNVRMSAFDACEKSVLVR